MKRINSFAAAAVAMLAAVSCAKELPQNEVPAGEAVVYTATTDGGVTKAVLDGTLSKWKGGELITLLDGTNSFTFYGDAGEKPVSTLDFTYTPGEGQPEFTATEVMAVYPSGEYGANVADKTVTGVVIPDNQTLVADTYPATAVVAVAYSDDNSLEFKNAVALIKFKVKGDDVKYGAFYAKEGSGNLTGKYDVAYNEGNPVLTPVEAKQWVDFHMNDQVLSEEATYYVAVAPAEFEHGFELSLNGTRVISHEGAKTLERNHIYDLGTIEYVAPVEVDPSTLSWGICGDMTSWAENPDIPMTLDGDWFVAENVTVAQGQAFKLRADNNWSVNRGAGGDVKPVTVPADTEIDVYYNGQDMTVAAGTYNFYLSKDCSKFKVVSVGGEPEIPEVTPGEESEWALIGGFSEWKDVFFLTTENADVVVLEDVVMEAAQGFLVRKPTTDWADKYGAGNVNYIKKNSYILAAKNGADMCLETAGTYDIYFNTATKAVYAMETGTDYASATEQTVSGSEPEQEEPEVTEKMLYMTPNANWKQADARFAAFFFGNGDKWVSMVDSDSDGIYEVNIPEGYDYGSGNVIFCRMNPGTTSNNWNNKWNQTGDLPIPNDGTNHYTVKDGTWDKGGGTWSTK